MRGIVTMGLFEMHKKKSLVKGVFKKKVYIRINHLPWEFIL